MYCKGFLGGVFIVIDGLKKELKGWPFIKEIRREVVLVRGRKRVVGVYSCDRLGSNGNCTDYSQRPWFCKDTGVTGIPSSWCLLK